MSEVVEFDGRPEKTLTMEEFTYKLSGRKFNKDQAFRSHVTQLMRTHSGTAGKFTQSVMSCGSYYLNSLLRKRRLTLRHVEAFRRHLNVDMSPYMDNRYPPL